MSTILSTFGRYFVTGGLAAMVDAGGFTVLFQGGAATVPAAVGSFVLASVVNFLLSSRYVFARRASAALYLRFVAVALMGLAVNVSVTYLAATAFQIDPRLAKIIGIGTAFSLNFAMNLLLVFRAKP